MAPALTEASDPQTFHVAAHHHHSTQGLAGQSPVRRSTSPPATHLPLQYGGLKEPHACTDAHLAAALANGSRRPSRPPGAGGLACGREGCDPPPRPHPIYSTMDPQPGTPPLFATPLNTTIAVTTPHDTIINTAPQDTITSITPQHTTTTTLTNSSSTTITNPVIMGQDTALDAMAPPQRSPRPPPHDGDILALIGKDFPNVNEVIDAIARLASNPQVLAAVDTASLTLPHATQPLPVVLPHHQPQEVLPAPQEVPREERARQLLEELDRRQWLLERRQARLQRRLRRVTSRGLSATVSGQLRDLLEHGHAALQQQQQEQQLLNPAAQAPTPPSSEVSLDTLKTDTMRNMSATTLVNLARRVEASQGNKMGLTPPRPQQVTAGASTPTPTSVPAPPLALPESTRVEVAAVAAEMQAAAQAHTHHDSDATETSSGGESCDEMEGFPETNTHCNPVRERAYARYCRARAWVASRFTWIQAQVADLEYRILQQHKIYSHIRNNKGAVQVEEPSRTVTRDPAHLDLQDPALTCLASPTSTRTTVNGYHSRAEDGMGGGVMGGLCGGGGGLSDVNFTNLSSSSSSSARTQGIRPIKRRRLVRAGAGLGLCAGLRRGGVGGGGGKIPAVQCKCVPPLTCVLCTRIQGATQAPAPPDPYTQPGNERHARVDPTYHPVLSQPADVSLSGKFDVLLKTMDWQRQQQQQQQQQQHQQQQQQQQQTATSKVITIPLLRPGTAAAVAAAVMTAGHTEKKKKKKSSKDKDLKKDHKKHKKNNNSNNNNKKGRITLKLKRSLFTNEVTKDGELKRKKVPNQEPTWTPVIVNSGGSGTGGGGGSGAGGGGGGLVSTLPPSKKARLDDEDDASSLYGSSIHSSPSASPAPIDRSTLKRHSTSSSSSTTNQKNKQTTSSNSYDIDNIVIPYSMAASTRLEKLEYKEIQTPKWRVVPYFPNNVYNAKSRATTITTTATNTITTASAASRDDDFEDVSEEAVIARHNRSEELERKKFLQYLHMQVTTSRSSRSRRTDSSGTNTPDHPLSPRPPDQTSDTISPLATPPNTPLAQSEDSNQSTSLPAIASIQNSSSSNITVSTTSSTSITTTTTTTTTTAFSSTCTTLTSQPKIISTSTALSSQQQHQQPPSQLIIQNSQISSSSLLSNLPSSLSSSLSSPSSTVSLVTTTTTTSTSTSSSFLPTTVVSSSSSTTTTTNIASSGLLSLPSLSSILNSSRRNRTLSSSSTNKSKGPTSIEALAEKLEDITPYEQRVFPLDESELMLITRETDDCDTVDVPSLPIESPIKEIPVKDKEINTFEQGGRLTPLSEMTDSAPEEEGEYDDTATPKWTISGLKDATGQYVLQIQRN